MADKSRRSEERAASTGNLEAEAAVWVARLRAGEITRERVQLAAFLGSEPARTGLDPADVPTLPAEPSSSEFATLYASLGREVATRSALALGRELKKWHDGLIDDPTEERLELVASWLQRPDKKTAEGLARDFARESTEDEVWSKAWQFPLREVAREIGTVPLADDEDGLREAMAHVVEALGGIFTPSRNSWETEAALWKAVATELEDWALGEAEEDIDGWEARQSALETSALEQVGKLDFRSDVTACGLAAAAVLRWANQWGIPSTSLGERKMGERRTALARALKEGSRTAKELAGRYAAARAQIAQREVGAASDQGDRERALASLIAWAQHARGGPTAEVWAQLDAGLEDYRRALAAGAASEKPGVTFDPARLRRRKRKPPPN